MTSVLRVPASFFVWGGSDPSLQCQSPRRQQDWCSNMVAVCSVEGMLTLSWLWDLANTVVSRGHSRGCPVLRIYWIWAGITEHHWSDMAAVQCLLWMAANQQSDISSCALWASLSGTFLQTLPDLVTQLKGHFLSLCSCPPTRSATSKRFRY